MGDSRNLGMEFDHQDVFEFSAYLYFINLLPAELNSLGRL